MLLHQYQIKAQRPITPSEKLYLVGDAMNHSCSLQLVLEMNSSVDVPSLNKAIIQASSANPYVHMRAKLRYINSIWYNVSHKSIDSEVSQVIEMEWDGHDIQGLSLFHGHKFEPSHSATQIIYIKGKRHFLVFRVFHGVMDGMGLYHWVKEIFRAWRKVPLIGTDLAMTDYDFLRQKRKIEYRPNFPLDCIAPTGNTGSAHTHYLWHKVTLSGKINAVTAKICQILLENSTALGAERARFMIPVDLRHHVKANTTANFANPIFIEAKKGADWSSIYCDIVKQLSCQNELHIGTYDAYLHHLPLPLLKVLLNALIYYQNKKNQYMMSGIISKLSINLSELESEQDCKAIDGFFLPINAPIAPIVLIVTEHNDVTNICFSVSSAHATPETCTHLANQFKQLIDEPELVADSSLPYCDTLWPVYNNTLVEFPQEKTIFTKIWESSIKNSHNHALISGKRIITYKQLSHRVLELASFFSDIGVGCGDKVAIYLPRNEDMICSMLACWYLGAAYIPIDITSPITWVLALLQDAQPVLVIHEECAALKQHYPGLSTHIPLQIISSKTPKSNGNSLTQLAYIIYTSGSTGTPKGVMINHGQLLNYLSWAVEAYGNNNQPYHTALFTSIAFDLTVTSLYLPLLSGGSMMLIPEPINILTLKDIFTKRTINFLKLTPSHLRMISSLPMSSGHQLTLVVGGEELPSKLARSVVEKLPAARIFNEYGPTETTVGCMVHQFDVTNDLQGSVPIGIPTANTRIYCLDSKLKPVKIAEEGEIYIAGTNVGVGYLNEPQLTSKYFMDDPFFPGARMYQSGDLAKHREDGLLVYLGRKDQQTKIRGHRIELSEIENILLAIQGISQAVVTLIKQEQFFGEANNQLAAYIVSDANGQEMNLRNELSAILPSYMIPKYFIFLTELPLTVNGKVDYKKLPEPVSELIFNKIEEHDDLLTQIRQLFANVLSLPLEVIDNHVNFGDLGGDSMQMAYMINEMITKMISSQHHDAFSNELERLLVCATPYNFYKHLSKII
ncbi:non-ribosomal peptide synthetase [Fluoribacter gormanii]|uniref:Amino acid adenylation domain-containing protein n=1 Tax=Fluoribacter gormanii TaxID=464 RepID=A0A377GIT1_9GAMM|nr:non-ribosomal peptide synthetase [Fluoribacter gormanii]KTD00314.1 non-ribosomal peptide synthetase [Fluoribacter gormanii]SIQ90848.1 amino acid adenylation domain-containing protein [Fluoribacter gormanii]STO24691.1 Tyrocidine synthase III [Fluoribacter gormanii]